MKLPLAIQLYSVRDDMEKDFEGTVKKIKELGYEGVEFAGLFGKTGLEVKALCDELDLVPVSAHVPYYDMLENPEAVLKDYQDLGCKYVLQTELDTCWVNVGGEEPAAYVEKYTGRAPVVHLKDFAGQKGNGPLYKLIGIEEEETAASENTFEFRPVGSGCQDWKKIIASAEKAGAQWLIVEQDDPSMEKSPIECAEMSINYLKNL